MKTLKCDRCEFSAEAQDFDVWTKIMHGHWLADHADVMKEMQEKPKAKEEGEKWMADMRKLFEDAPEN
jgi:hypothetical protein